MELHTASGKDITYNIQYYQYNNNSVTQCYTELSHFKMVCDDIGISNDEYEKFLTEYNKFRDKIINGEFSITGIHNFYIYVTIYNDKIYTATTNASFRYKLDKIGFNNNLLTNNLLQVIYCNHWYYELNDSNGYVNIKYTLDDNNSKNVLGIYIYKDFVKLDNNVGKGNYTIFRGHRVRVYYTKVIDEKKNE